MPDNPVDHPMVPHKNGPSDNVLITMVQGGDMLAFRSLVERHRERVRNLIWSVLNAPELIDDLAQEVFIKIYEALPGFRFDSAFSTWMYRITVNRCRDELRRRKVRRFFSLQAMLESGDHEVLRGISVHPPDPDTAGFVQRALARLPDRYRVPVVLRDMDGLSYEEIAEVLQCELGTVKSRIARGRTQLRTLLQPLLEETPNLETHDVLQVNERHESDVTARTA